MKDIAKTGLILMAVTVISAGVLAAVNLITKPTIDSYKAEQAMRAMREVLPEAKDGVFVPRKKGDFEYYEGYADPDTTQPVGYVFLAAGSGYSSVIETIVGVDLGGTIEGIKILSQQETPGLGARVTEVKHGDTKPWFQVQFEGKKALELALRADGGDIDAITGATISSRTVVSSIRKAAGKLLGKRD